MRLVDIAFKVRKDDYLSSLSKDYPSLKLYQWCNREHDIIEVVVEDPEEHALVMKQLPLPEGVIAKTSGGNIHVIKKKCVCMDNPGVVKFTENLELLYVSPSLLHKGWQFHRVIAFKHSAFKTLVRRLEEADMAVEILHKTSSTNSISSLMTIQADTLFSSITTKQMDALMTAYRNGYYRFPRKVDVKALAAKRKVPRTTFHEHLQKAESKIITNLVPYAQLYTRPI